MNDDKLRPNELEIITLLSGMVRECKEAQTQEELMGAIAKTSDAILTITQGSQITKNNLNNDYPIKVLQSKIVEHKLAIHVLKENDDECYGAILFTDEEITNHEENIIQLQNAIENLL